MAKYLIKASYTAQGVKGLMKEGGSARKATVEKLITSLGGKLESFYYAFGDNDAWVTADVPDAVTMVALSMAINSTGVVTVSAIPLISPADIDEACKKTIGYRAPGA